VIEEYQDDDFDKKDKKKKQGLFGRILKKIRNTRRKHPYFSVLFVASVLFCMNVVI